MARRQADGDEKNPGLSGRIYAHILKNAGVTRPERAQFFGVSPNPVTQQVEKLRERGLVRLEADAAAGTGRKAAALAAVPDARFAVGLEITADSATAALVDMTGGIAGRLREKMPFSADPAHAERLGAFVNRFVGISGAEPDRVLGVGVALPGILSEDGAVLDSPALSVCGYRTEAIARSIDLPCLFSGNAAAAAFHEVWPTGDQGSFALLLLGDSVDGAVRMRGEPHDGDNRRAGGFGHMTIVRNGRRCRCGQLGCLDAYCRSGILAERCGGDLEVFFRLLGEGSPATAAAWASYQDDLATAVHSIRMALDCDIVLGGAVGARMGGDLDAFHRRVALLDPFGDDGGFVSICRTLDAPAAGAALLHTARFVETLPPRRRTP